MSLLLSGSYTNGITFSFDNRQTELELINVNQILDGLIDLQEIDDFYNWGLKFQIESLRATYWLGGSLRRVNYSNIFPEDSQATRINKLIDQEAENRIGLEAIMLRGANRQTLSRQAFQHIGREQQKELLKPFLTLGAVKLMNRGDILSYKLVDMGDGLIRQYTDYIQIEAECSYIITGYHKESMNLQSFSFGALIGNTPQLIRPANANRVKLNMVNTGNAKISFHYGSNDGLIIGQTLELDGNGSSWNDEGFYIDKQALWAISHGGETRLVGKEMVRA